MELTKERLLKIQSWSETYGPGSNVVLPAEEAEGLARVALASLEAEPVAWLYSASFERGHVEGGLTDAPGCDMPVYTAPPAPVSVPGEAISRAVDEIMATYAGRADECRKLVRKHIEDACRAAMLQGADGNSPVIPDGWVACSERMPEDTQMVLAFSHGEIVAAYWNYVMCPIEYKKYRAFTYLSGSLLEGVTHWMPMPAAPQQEVK